MSNTFGKIFTLTTFGESHGPAIGGVVDGMPAGIEVDMDFIQRELDRRKPGQSRITTDRKEGDRVEPLSGIFEGKTTGSPIAALTRHSDSVILFTDEDIWNKLIPGQMPALKAAINVKDWRMLWYRDEKVFKAWENRERSFANHHPKGMKPDLVSFHTNNLDKMAIINYTSGTTGNPKGVMLTYGALSDTDEFANSHFPNHPGQTIVSMLPMAHMYGLAIEFIHPNVDGVTVYFLGKTPSPTTLLQAMKEVKPYMVVTVPLVMEKVYANSIKPALDKMQKFYSIPYAERLIYKIVRKKIISATVPQHCRHWPHFRCHHGSEIRTVGLSLDCVGLHLCRCHPRLSGRNDFTEAQRHRTTGTGGALSRANHQENNARLHRIHAYHGRCRVCL